MGSAEFTWRAMLAVMATAFAVVVPFFFLGNASGHDFDFHVSSWMDVARQWRAGVWLPRWAVWANYGFGEPRFIFYPPLSLMLGAGLGLLLPWKMVPGTMVWLLLALAGASMLRLGREWLAPREAAVAAVLYAANPYHLVVVYYRSAYAELLASALFPLLVFYAARLGRQDDSAVTPLALVFAAIWLANAPAAVIASYALAVLLVIMAATEKSLGVLGWGAAGIALGFLLAAFYIVPAAWEQKWVNITQVLSSGLRPEQSFLFTSIDDPEHNLFNLKVSAVAAGEIVASALAALFFNRQRDRGRNAWSALVALGLASVVLMLPASNLAWRYLPELRFAQFPWRWLFPLNVVLAIFCVGVLSRTPKKWLPPVLLAAALVATGGVIVHDASWDSEDVSNLQSAIQSGEGYEGSDEYAPLACDHYDLPAQAPEVAIVGSPASRTPQARETRVRVIRSSPEDKIIAVNSPQPLLLALRLVNYPAWRAEENDQPASMQAKPGTAQMLIPVAAGHTRLEVKFTRTSDRTAGTLLSVLGVVAWCAVVRWGRRFKHTNPTRKK